MWLKQQSPLVLTSSCLCSSIFQIQKGLFCSLLNNLDCCGNSKLTFFFRSLNVTIVIIIFLVSFNPYLQAVLLVLLLKYPMHILLFLMSMTQFFYQFPSLTTLGGILAWL